VLDGDIGILILGDAGTGKERLARAIHGDSVRRQQAFVAVDCTTIPDTLIHAVLFGGDDGAVIGAPRHAAQGAVAQAHGGTLFLDGVGDLPHAVQASLLRVLQLRQVTPPDGSPSSAVDIKLICASRHDLRDRVEHGHFREDLFYRLNGLTVTLPPLRERSDLPVLARRIVEEQAPGRRLPLAPEVLALFEQFHWPGNLRQLEGVLRTACAMAAGDPLITRHHLAEDFFEVAAPSLPTAGARASAETLGVLKVDAIRRAVAAAGGNISEASKRLGVSRSTIYRTLHWKQADG